jgi:hypothetical protein
MAAPKRYNWTAMGTTPEAVLAIAPHLRFGNGRDMPESIDWAMTPQGARFWYLAFLKGDKRAELALARMVAQAKWDTRTVVPPYVPPLYELEKLAPSPRHILSCESVCDFIPTPPMAVIWAATPQGPAFWYEFFATAKAVRDNRPLEALFDQARRALRLKGGTDV